jgi:hypothetical protein
VLLYCFDTVYNALQNTILIAVCETHMFYISFRHFFERFIAKKVCTAGSRTNYKTVPLTNLNKYLYEGKCEINLNVNNRSEKKV